MTDWWHAVVSNINGLKYCNTNIWAIANPGDPKLVLAPLKVEFYFENCHENVINWFTIFYNTVETWYNPRSNTLGNTTEKKFKSTYVAPITDYSNIVFLDFLKEKARR